MRVVSVCVVRVILKKGCETLELAKKFYEPLKGSNWVPGSGLWWGLIVAI
jgi:hypothetical protein